MSVYSSNLKYLQLEEWILIGKDFAQPKETIVHKMGYDRNPNRLDDDIRKYQKFSGNQIAYNKNGWLYIPLNQEEQDEFNYRSRNSSSETERKNKTISLFVSLKNCIQCLQEKAEKLNRSSNQTVKHIIALEERIERLESQINKR